MVTADEVTAIIDALGLWGLILMIVGLGIIMGWDLIKTLVLRNLQKPIIIKKVIKR